MFISGKAVVGSIIGSVIISALIMGGFIYFGLPMIFPHVEEGNVVLQTKYGEWDTPAYIFDDELSSKKMNDTELSITISENSRIHAAFSAMALLSLYPVFTVKCVFNVSLVVQGVTERIMVVAYYDGNPSYPHYRQLTFNLYINLISQPLPAGTYDIAVFWVSGFDANGANSLSVAHAPTYNYTRTLLLQEIIME